MSYFTLDAEGLVLVLWLVSFATSVLLRSYSRKPAR